MNCKRCSIPMPPLCPSKAAKRMFCSRSCSARGRASPDARFLTRLSAKPNGCLEWQGNRLAKMGYGQISVNGRVIGVHRYAWERANGPVPLGLMVLHRCDNPPCCNVSHLFLGTNADNMADRKAKGRYANVARGSGSAQAKLTEAQVLSIRGDLRRHAEIAAGYGVTVSAVSAIKTRRNWTHVR